MNDALRRRILRKLDTLPETQVYQVLDYIEFMESRYNRGIPEDVTALQRLAERLEDGLRKGRVNPANLREAFQLIATADRVLSSVSTAGKQLLQELQDPVEDRPTGDRPTGDRPTRDRSPGDRATGDRPTRDRSPGDRATGDRATGDRATGDRATGDRATGDRTTEDRSPGGTPSGRPMVPEEGLADPRHRRRSTPPADPPTPSPSDPAG
jgi:hypothetical protein